MSTKLVVEQCCNCGVEFAMPETLQGELRKAKAFRSFYCPNGHGQHYTGDTEADKLRRERDRLLQQVAQKDDEIAANRRGWEKAEKDLNRLKKRTVINGVCPCCTRSFENLKRHMATKHPDYNVVPIKAEAV